MSCTSRASRERASQSIPTQRKGEIYQPFENKTNKRCALQCSYKDAYTNIWSGESVNVLILMTLANAKVSHQLCRVSHPKFRALQLQSARKRLSFNQLCFRGFPGEDRKFTNR